MLDHLGIKVSNVEESRRFYIEVLKPLGYGVMREYGSFIGFGDGKKPDFWISPGTAPGATHIAFVAANRAAVDAFYKAALAAGARDNGPPGPRPQYHPGYYGAFVYDLDGNNVEAVCHKPE